MDLKEISKLQDKIEDFNESLLDAKEVIIDKRHIDNKILSDISYKSQVLISSLFTINTNNGWRETITHDEILQMICDASGKSLKEIENNSGNRKRETLIPRQVHEVILHSTFKKSLSATAKVYNKNHATILNSLKVVNNLIETDSEFRKKYGYIFLLCNKINPRTKDKINIHKLSKQL